MTDLHIPPQAGSTGQAPTAVAQAGRKTQSFGRFEFKYIVRDRLRHLLEEELRGFMSIDPFCRNLPGQTYLVRSLYFDDACFQDYFAKIDGHLNREKYRLRTYGSDQSAPTYLEIKGRQNQYTYKHRTELSPVQLALIQSGRWSSLALCPGATQITDRFAAIACRRNLLAQAGVTYVRRPYISERDYRFRVTIDSELRALPGHAFNHGGFSRPIISGQSVVEIKFEYAIPAWFQRLIGTYELKRVSISKYCRAAETLTLVTNLE